MNYIPHPTAKVTKSRRARKSGRNESFRHNKSLRAKLNREKRAARLVNDGQN